MNSRTWERCYLYYVRTGEWPMDLKDAVINEDDMLYRGDMVSIPKFNDLSEGWHVDDVKVWEHIIVKHKVLRDSYIIPAKDAIHIRTNKPVNEVPFRISNFMDVFNGHHITGFIDTDKIAKMLEGFDDNPNPFNAPMVPGFMSKGLMPNPNRRHPRSRDWEFECLTIECLREKCAANHNKKCVMPSRIKISLSGKCIGFHPRCSGK